MRSYTLIIALIVSLSLYSEDFPKDMGLIKVNSLRIEQFGDSLYVDMNAELTHKVSAWNGLIITPFLMTDNEAKEFPSSVYKGAASYIVGGREGSNDQNTYKWSKDHLGYRFNAVVPFEEWMRKAEFKILFSEGPLCSKSPDLFNLINLGKAKLVVPKPYSPSWKVALVAPLTEEIKDRDVYGEAFLDFAAGKSVLQVNYRRNEEELAKITGAVNELLDNDDVTITGITITGYVSLDGNEAKNKQIATSRANALKKYLIRTCQLSDNTLKAVGYGEDWDTFKTLISDSDIPDKESILDIVNEEQSADQREYELKLLRKGVPYKDILKIVYPKLRRMSYRINYKVRDFKLDEAKVIVKTRPAQLSLSELFMVANSYPMDSNDFFEVFDTAVRLFPDNETANANAAAIALEKNDMENVQKYMAKVSVMNPVTVNNYGIISAKKGDYKKALDNFESASAAGLDEAIHNLKELKHMMEIERIIRETMEENKGR